MKRSPAQLLLTLLAVASVVVTSSQCDWLRPAGKTLLPLDIKANTRAVPAGWFVFGGVPKCGYNLDMASCPDSPSGQFPWRFSYLSAFHIETHEVTNAEYLQCVQDGACEYWKSCYTDAPLATEILSDLSTKLCPYVRDEVSLEPTRDVSWKQARNYCHWRYKSQGKQGDLPTEAQWERAAVGGFDDTAGAFVQPPLPMSADNLLPQAPGCQDIVMQISSDERNNCSIDAAWPQDNNPVYQDDDSHPFASYHYGTDWSYDAEGELPRQGSASPVGAIDLAGNVAEWVLDAYSRHCDDGQNLLGATAAVQQDCAASFSEPLCLSQRWAALQDIADPTSFATLCNPVNGDNDDLNVERVVKGGHYQTRSWCELSPRARLSRRPLDSDETLGFRCAYWDDNAETRNTQCAELSTAPAPDFPDAGLADADEDAGVDDGASTDSN